jgi:ABC-type nitrate/sulfonate/bicarbonate transport system ATPase subunit
VYDHETADGMYGVLPYVAARYAVLLPQMLVFPTLFSIIVYYMTGLRQEAAAIGVFIAVMFAVHMLGFSLAFVCVAAQRSFAQASLMANSIYTFFGLVSGLLVQLDSVPVWLAWIKRISFLNFSFRILAANEFRDRTWPCPGNVRASSPAACAAYDGNAVLARLGVAPDASDAAVALGVNFVVLVVAAAGVLAVRPRLAARFEAAFAPLRLPEAAAAAAPPPPPPKADGDAADGDAAADAADDVTVPIASDDMGLSAELFRAFAPVTVTLRDVGLTLRPTRRLPAGKAILQRISMTLRPGQLTGIMGASGSGKSSLLNALAARIRPGEGSVAGVILFNGAPLRPAAARAVVGYVTQHDALLPLLTVTETLHFAARLRLPAGMAPAAKLERVFTVIAELGLKDCAGTMVGADGGGGDGPGRRGVSGGEKRRVSIAVQMLTDPSVLLLVCARVHDAACRMLAWLMMPRSTTGRANERAGRLHGVQHRRHAGAPGVPRGPHGGGDAAPTAGGPVCHAAAVRAACAGAHRVRWARRRRGAVLLRGARARLPAAHQPRRLRHRRRVRGPAQRGG